MREIIGNIWDFHDAGEWIVITTNGCIKVNGQAVMGRGIAKQAAERFPKLASELGTLLTHYGNKLFVFGEYRLFTLPTKRNWWEISDTILIETNIKELYESIHTVLRPVFNINKVYLVRPGCGNGGLNWKDVKPILERYLDDRFIVVSNK